MDEDKRCMLKAVPEVSGMERIMWAGRRATE